MINNQNKKNIFPEWDNLHRKKIFQMEKPGEFQKQFLLSQKARGL